MLVLTLKEGDSAELWEELEGGKKSYLGRVLVVKDERHQKRLRVGFDLPTSIKVLRPEVSDGRGNYVKKTDGPDKPEND